MSKTIDLAEQSTLEFYSAFTIDKDIRHLPDKFDQSWSHSIVLTVVMTLSLAVATFPVWAPFISPSSAFASEWATLTAFVYFIIVISDYSYLLCRVMSDINKTPEIDSELLYSPEYNHVKPEFSHVIVITVYDEKFEIIKPTLDCLSQDDESQGMHVVITIEERNPDRDHLSEAIRGSYESSFASLHICYHPDGIRGEVRGTCSNINHGVRWAKQKLVDELGIINPETCVLTKMDTDTLFLRNYFRFIKKTFIEMDPSERECKTFQPYISHHYPGIYQNISWWNRTICAMISVVINAAFIRKGTSHVSTYSVPFRTIMNIDFWDPSRIGEDVHQTMKFRKYFGPRWRMIPVPVVSVSSPTIGRNQWEEIRELVRQQQRWAAQGIQELGYLMTNVVWSVKSWRGFWSWMCHILSFFQCFVMVPIIISLFIFFGTFVPDLILTNYWCLGVPGPPQMSNFTSNDMGNSSFLHTPNYQDSLCSVEWSVEKVFGLKWIFVVFIFMGFALPPSLFLFLGFDYWMSRKVNGGRTPLPWYRFLSNLSFPVCLIFIAFLRLPGELKGISSLPLVHVNSQKVGPSTNQHIPQKRNDDISVPLNE